MQVVFLSITSLSLLLISFFETSLLLGRSPFINYLVLLTSSSFPVASLVFRMVSCARVSTRSLVVGELLISSLEVTSSVSQKSSSIVISEGSSKGGMGVGFLWSPCTNESPRRRPGDPVSQLFESG